MPGLELRYVGQDRLPARLSEFDVERYFALTDSDIAAIKERFRRDRLAGVAIQLVFLRASGRTLDHVGTLPRQLLRHIGERLGLPTPTIASLRTLYQRYKTLYEHQVWICEYLGMTSIGPRHWAGLEAWMRQDAIESLTLDELLQHSHCWLYERRILIPAERKLRDLGRSIWSDVERDLLALIKATVTKTQLVHADSVLSAQHGTSGMRVLEWLKTPPARHSPSTLTETHMKVRFLKKLGAHTWILDAVPIEKQRAYAQRIQARRPANTSITLIHGCCLTGKTWETTPDGRMGWDEYFVRKGYPTYVIDQSDRGRSAGNISIINSVKAGKAAPSQLPEVFAASHESAWKIFRFGPEYPKTFAGEQFPVEAQAALWQQMVPDWSGSVPTPNPSVPALSQLAAKLRHTVLISHSQSGIYPFEAAAISTQGIAGIVAIEPGECPSASGELSPYTKIPIVVLFGDYIDQSARWAPRLKACQAFVSAVNHEGGHAQWVLLPNEGIHGNTHMMMQDRNNLEVADWILRWIKLHATAVS